MSTNEMSMDDRVEKIVEFLDSKKADELEAFNLENIDYLAKRVIIAGALSGKHDESLAENLKKELKAQEEVLHIDASDDWVVMDLGDILIHIMTKDARQTYSIEDFLTELSSGKFSVGQSVNYPGIN